MEEEDTPAPDHAPRQPLWRRTASALLVVVVVVAVVGILTPARALIGGWLAHPAAPPTQTTAAVPPTPSPEEWSALEGRPLHPPQLGPGGACPVSRGHPVQQWGAAVGSDTVYAVYGTASSVNGVLQYADAQTFGAGTNTTDWGGQKVLWIIPSGYQGPVLIREEGQLDGPHRLRFNGGILQALSADLASAPLLSELRLVGGAVSGQTTATWGTYLRLQAPGCYAMQVDGSSFTEVIVFRAVPV